MCNTNDTHFDKISKISLKNDAFWWKYLYEYNPYAKTGNYLISQTFFTNTFLKLQTVKKMCVLYAHPPVQLGLIQIKLLNIFSKRLGGLQFKNLAQLFRYISLNINIIFGIVRLSGLPLRHHPSETNQNPIAATLGVSLWRVGTITAGLSLSAAHTIGWSDFWRRRKLATRQVVRNCCRTSNPKF